MAGYTPRRWQPDPVRTGYADPAAYNRWKALKQARDRLPSSDTPAQNHLGGLEHAAYAESRARESPVYGALEQAALIPAWTAAKALGLQGGRSEPSLHEMQQGYRGLGRGVAANVGDLMSRVAGDPQPVARPMPVAPMTQGLQPNELLQYVLRHYRQR